MEHGGLVRAYTEATKKAIEKAEIVEKTKGYQAEIKIGYSDLEALKYYLKSKKIKIIKIDYSDIIDVEIEINQKQADEISNNYNNTNFKIINYKTIKEKFVEI